MYDTSELNSLLSLSVTYSHLIVPYSHCIAQTSKVVALHLLTALRRLAPRAKAIFEFQRVQNERCGILGIEPSPQTLAMTGVLAVDPRGFRRAGGEADPVSSCKP